MLHSFLTSPVVYGNYNFMVVMSSCQLEFLKESPKKIYYKSTVFSWNDFIPEPDCSFLKFPSYLFLSTAVVNDNLSASLVIRILYPSNHLRCCLLKPGYGSTYPPACRQAGSLRKDDHSLLLTAQKRLLCGATKLACAYIKHPVMSFELVLSGGL